MRRSRFAKAIEVSEVRERASIRDALSFDVTRPETSAEDSLCEWRVAGLEHAPLILGVTHLLIALTCLILSKTLSYSSLADNPLIPSGLVIAVDSLAAAALIARNRFNIDPHTAIRALGLYLAAAGMLWTWFG